MQIDLNAAIGQSSITFADILHWFFMAKWILYGALLLILVLIALLVYTPFSLIIKYEGLAFFMSGLSGYFLTLGMTAIPQVLLADATKYGDLEKSLLQFIGQVIGFVAAESQKFALIFMGLGALLILIRLFLVHKYSGEKHL
jgi:hypothetical protein